MKTNVEKNKIGLMFIVLVAMVLVCGGVERLRPNTPSRDLEAGFKNPPRLVRFRMTYTSILRTVSLLLSRMNMTT